MHKDPPDRLNPQWSTASFGDDADTLPAELATLGEHLTGCRPVAGLDALQSAARSLRGLVAARFVTTLLALSLMGVLVMAL